VGNRRRAPVGFRALVFWFVLWVRVSPDSGDGRGLGFWSHFAASLCNPLLSHVRSSLSRSRLLTELCSIPPVLPPVPGGVNIISKYPMQVGDF
jgi:hypothetical protein